MRRWGMLVGVVALVLAGCGGDDDTGDEASGSGEDTTTTSESTTTTTEAPTTTAEPTTTTTEPPSPVIVYEVTGSGGASVDYDVADVDGQRMTRNEQVTLPWSVEITDGEVSNPSMLVFVENPTGSESCRILRDGEEIAASSEMTGPLLSCPPAPPVP